MFSPVAKKLKRRYGDKHMKDSLAALVAEQAARRHAYSSDLEQQKEDDELMLEIRNQKYNNTDYSVLPQLQQKYLIELERSKRSVMVDPAVGIGLNTAKPSRVRKQLPLITASRNHLPGTERSVARSKAARRKRRVTGGRARVERKLYGSKMARFKALYDNEERSWTAAGKEKAREQKIALRNLRYASATMIQKHYRLTFD